MYRSYFVFIRISANIEMQVYCVTCNEMHVKPDLLLPTLIPLSGVGTTCFYFVVIKILHLFLRPAACLTSTLLETGVHANDSKCSQDQQLNVPFEARRSSR
jgi:hypothetical protein